MAIEFDFSELSKYIATMSEAVSKGAPDKFVRAFAVRTAERIVAKAKPKTPVGTPESTGQPGYIGGSLRAAWGIGEVQRAEFLGSNRGKQGGAWDGSEVEYQDLNPEQVAKTEYGTTEVVIWNGMNYASHVEFGHATRGGGGWVEGYHMLAISMEEVESDLPSEFRSEFADFMVRERLGGG